MLRSVVGAKRPIRDNRRAMWQVEVLKRDAFGRVERLSRERDGAVERWIRRVACGASLPLSRQVARLLLGRERRALLALDGRAHAPRVCTDPAIAAVLSPGGEAPRAEDTLVREHVDGVALHRCEVLPLDFFEALEELVRELHACGVAHNDLHKEQNIVVAPDGSPRLIDFQLASVHAPGSRALVTRARDDLRHVAKHRRRYLRYARVVDVAPAAELLASPPRAPRRTGAALVWRRTGKPLYNFVTRSLLGRRDGEERRETGGAWPRWGPPLRAR